MAARGSGAVVQWHPMAGASEKKAPGPRVLVIFPGALGDLICLGPALRALARRHREATLELMAREELAMFAVGRMAVGRGHSIDRRELAALFAEDNDLGEAARFFRPFDRIHSFFASGDLRFRDSLQRAAAPGAVSFHAFRPAGAGHMAEGYLNEIGNPNDPLDGRIDLPGRDIDDAGRMLARLRMDKSPVLLLFPGSGSPQKNWPAERFAAIAARPPAGFRPLVILGPAEIDLEPLFATAGITTLGRQPLGMVAALASLAGGFVGNDSGISHLAAAAGAAGVVIFGPTEPALWRPLGNTIRAIRRGELAKLAADEVMSALNEVVGRPTGR